MLIDDLKKQNLLALKEKDTSKRAILSVVINKYMILATAKDNKNDLNDLDLIKIILKTLKELEEEKKGYESVGNDLKVEDISHQIDVLKVYTPTMLEKEEIINIINGLENKTVPFVMNYFKTNYLGKVELSLVSKCLKEIV